MACDLNTHHLQQRQHCRDVLQMRNIADHHDFRGEQRRGQNRQRRILGAGNRDVTRQRGATLNQ